ncbi:hypothetical protein H6F77_10825 [Microcoleus sp. FACHB-831]|nr:hypothetical protein [Microcoleus sp. FACHB-831]
MIFIENLLFLGSTSSFLLFTGWVWRKAKPFSIPKPLPSWFYVWFYIVLIGGIVLPLLALILWGVWWSHPSVLQALIPYFAMLGLQILAESVTLNRFHSCVWVMIPCLYVPYRIWQLHTALTLVSLDSELIWVQRLLLAEIILWIFNYGVHLSQIPRLLGWEVHRSSDLNPPTNR